MIHNKWCFDRFIGRTTQPERLFSCDFYPPQTTLSVVRNHTTGEILDLNEVCLI